MGAGLTLGSLFDGIGGFCYAAQLTGRITPIWAAEIEQSCIDITRYRFPEVMHVGSVTDIKGDEIQPVDIITFGSPCQDLSIAGQRKGLKGNRSGLFMEAIRIIEEMRLATNGKYPTFIIWENVPGAFSSADGADFRAVLEKVTKTNIPMPASGKWATAGMVRGGAVDAAWRTLDAQFWGVPQRRKRIYLVGDFGGQRAGEILFKSESLLGYSAKSKGERAETAGESTDSLRAENSRAGGEVLGLDFAHADSVVRTFEDKTPTLMQNMGSAGGQVPCILKEQKAAGFLYTQGAKAHGLGYENEKAPTLMTSGSGAVLIEDKVQCLTPWDSQSKRIYSEKGGYPTLQGMSGAGQDQSAVFIEKKNVIPLRDEVTRNKSSNGLGVGAVGGPAPTLTTADIHSVFYEAYQHHGYRESDTSGTLTTDQNSTIRGDTPLVVRTDKKAFELNQHGGYRETEINGTLRAAGGDYGGGSETIVTESHKTKENTPSKPKRSIKDILKKAVQAVTYIIRRLTPVECERLQGYPDNWTKWGADGNVIADTARYRAIGNSICVFCAERVYLGILDALEADKLERVQNEEMSSVR